MGVKESCQVQPFDHKDPASAEPSLRHVELTLEGSTGASQAKEESNESKMQKVVAQTTGRRKLLPAKYSCNMLQPSAGSCHIAGFFGGLRIASFCSHMRPCATCSPLERSTWLICSRLGNPTEFGMALEGKALPDLCCSI